MGSIQPPHYFVRFFLVDRLFWRTGGVPATGTNSFVIVFCRECDIVFLSWLLGGEQTEKKINSDKSIARQAHNFEGKNPDFFHHVDKVSHGKNRAHRENCPCVWHRQSPKFSFREKHEKQETVSTNVSRLSGMVPEAS